MRAFPNTPVKPKPRTPRGPSIRGKVTVIGQKRAPEVGRQRGHIFVRNDRAMRLPNRNKCCEAVEIRNSGACPKLANEARLDEPVVSSRWCRVGSPPFLPGEGGHRGGNTLEERCIRSLEAKCREREFDVIVACLDCAYVGPNESPIGSEQVERRRDLVTFASRSHGSPQGRGVSVIPGFDPPTDVPGRRDEQQTANGVEAARPLIANGRQLLVRRPVRRDQVFFGVVSGRSVAAA